jgi:hypothetical protein
MTDTDQSVIDVNAYDNEGKTLFHRCCQTGDIEKIRLMLSDPTVDINKPYLSTARTISYDSDWA